MEGKKRGWGGARPGSGRPKGDKELFALRIGGEAAQMIKCQPNRSDFICNCIREYMQREAKQNAELPKESKESTSHNVISFVCSEPLFSYLQSLENRTAYIISCIEEKMRRDGMIRLQDQDDKSH